MRGLYFDFLNKDLFTEPRDRRGHLATVVYRRAMFMQKTSRIRLAREIIASVKKEMQEPRLTESVRDGLSVQTSPTIKGFPVRSTDLSATYRSKSA